jgi:DNA-binding transcriptional LysR family regulator
MEFKKLEHIVALADAGSFVRAAEAVHLSQPAFSRSIQAAEAELGMRLFGRGGGSELKCTPSGAFVVERARRVLQEGRRMERDVTLFRQGMIGSISMGVGPFIAASILPALLTELHRRYPAVTVSVQVDNPMHLLDGVRREQHDFSVGDTREVPPDGGFLVRSIGRKRGRFYVRSGHPLLLQSSIRLADLAPCGIVSGRLPQAIRAALAKAMGIADSDSLPVVVECDDTHVLRQVALATDTAMIGNDDILAADLAAGRMVVLEVLDFPPAYSDLGIVSLQGRSHSPLAQVAINLLAAMARDVSEPNA